MNLLFLDLDGVLNDHTFNPQAQSCSLHPDCVREFNRILDRCNPDVVLSSAWRYLIHHGAMTLGGFKVLLRTHGVSNDINLVGITPTDEKIPQRGKQIQAWIDNHKDDDGGYYRYCVLDDMAFDIRECGHPCVITDGKRGLTSGNADEVIRILKGG